MIMYLIPSGMGMINRENFIMRKPISLCDLHNRVRVINSRLLGCAGYITRMGDVTDFKISKQEEEEGL